MSVPHWVPTPLVDVLQKNSRRVSLLYDQDYKQITVRLWGKGLALRGVCKGAAIAAAEQIQVEAGQFIISKIDARHGAFGLVPPELDGGVVSGDFPCFDVNASLMLPRFLLWLSRTEQFISLCRGASEGSTNRVRLKEATLLSSIVMLPPLTEQRQIVERLDAVSTRLKARAEAAERQQAELTAMLRALINTNVSRVRLEKLLTQRPVDVSVQKTSHYQFAGVYSFGRGVFRGQRKAGSDFAYPRLTTLHATDFVYPKLMAWEGAFGVVPPDCDGCVVSPEFPVFAVDQDRISPDVLAIHFSDPQTWRALSGGSTGTNARRRRLHPDNLLAYEMPVPPPRVQRLVALLMPKVTELRTHQAAIGADAAALLPAMLAQIFS